MSGPGTLNRMITSLNTADNYFVNVDGKQRVVTAPRRQPAFFLYLAPLRRPGGQADASAANFAGLTRLGGPNA